MQLSSSEKIVRVKLHVFQIEYSILTEGVVPFNGDLAVPIDGHTKFIAYYNPQTGTGCITLLTNNERQ